MYISPKIKIINDDEKNYFFCDICGYCLISNLDFKYHKKYGACEECYYTFVESAKETWNKDNKQIDKKKLQEYIYFRNKINTKKIKLSQK